jgi:hypothetical protein
MWERGSVQKGNCMGYRVDFIGEEGERGRQPGLQWPLMAMAAGGLQSNQGGA